MNKFNLMITFLFNKREKIEKIEAWLSEGTVVEEDNDVYDIKSSSVCLYTPHNPDGPSKRITSKELRRQMKKHKPLGAKSLDYYYANQKLIPEEFKKKTSIFLGTIYVDLYGHNFSPCLYFHSLRGVWIKSFYSFRDEVSLDHNFVPILSESLN